MDRRTLGQQIDLAAALYARNNDPAAREEIDRMSGRLAEFTALAVLERALAQCRVEDVRTDSVRQALDRLAEAMPEPWPVAQFS